MFPGHADTPPDEARLRDSNRGFCVLISKTIIREALYREGFARALNLASEVMEREKKEEERIEHN